MSSAFRKTQLMKSRNGFTLIELLVVISIIALLIGILLPALGASRQVARQMSSSTQIRGIHQANVVFAGSNKKSGGDGWFAGLSPTGGIAEAPPATATYTVANPRALTMPRHRYALLLEANFFTPEYIVSPADEAATVSLGGDVTSLNFSYCMADLGNNTGVDGYASPVNPLDARSEGRIVEWGETLNSSVPVLSDMNTGVGLNTISSLWTEEDSGQWEGGVAMNDNSVSFESSPIVENTRFSTFTLIPSDHLFVANDVNADGDASAPNGSNAIMVLGQSGEGRDQNRDSRRNR